MKIFLSIYLVLFLSEIPCFSSDIKYDSAQEAFLDFVDNLSSDNDKQLQKSLLNIVSNYPSSDYIATSYLLIVNHYLEKKEYKLATLFLDKYKEKFYTSSSEDFIVFMQNKIKYSQFYDIKKDQLLLLKAIEEIEESLLINSQSIYYYETSTMLTQLKLLNNMNNKKVAKLYKKIDKDKAAQVYEDKTFTYDNLKEPSKNIFMRIFY